MFSWQINSLSNSFDDSTNHFFQHHHYLLIFDKQRVLIVTNSTQKLKILLSSHIQKARHTLKYVRRAF